jgi:ATP-binding protein involved in chromosome partitioning
VRGIPGVADVDVQMTANVRSVSAPETGRTPLPGVKNVIAVGAGKGGVGKTTVAVNLALALARCGGRVGILDGDIYGPNVPIMLGLQQTQLSTDGKQILPAEKYGLQVVSMGFLTGDDAPVIWRGPMLHGAIQQFFRDVAWKGLDYLIVDMPPGTGDVALSLSQTVPVAGSILVTTPQQVSLADTRRAIRMYEKLNIKPLGVIENMSYYACPNCHHEADIFGYGGGEELARSERHRRSPRHQRAGVTGGSGVHVCRRADGGPDLHRSAQGRRGEQREDSADSRALTSEGPLQTEPRRPRQRWMRMNVVHTLGRLLGQSGCIEVVDVRDVSVEDVEQFDDESHLT